jgi:hypothetical protein
VGFVADDVALGHISLRDLRVFPAIELFSDNIYQGSPTHAADNWFGKLRTAAHHVSKNRVNIES